MIEPCSHKRSPYGDRLSFGHSVDVDYRTEAKWGASYQLVAPAPPLGSNMLSISHRSASRRPWRHCPSDKFFHSLDPSDPDP